MKRLLANLAPGFRILTGTALLFSVGAASAASDETSSVAPRHQSTQMAGKSSWAIAFDNDILVPGSRDQDYTYGINLAVAGARVENHWASLHQPLGWINKNIGLDGQIGQGIEASRIEYGLFGFTPEEISLTRAQQDDRPYASLIYVSSTRETYDSMLEVSWQSTLTLGVMGLSLVGELQESVHSLFGASEPKGWDNQISDGGEPTVRYSVSRQKLLFQNDSGFETKSTWQGSVGYITEASWSVSARAGKIRTPWVSFNPELTSYGEKSNPNASVKVFEHYAWAGISFKIRAYNAFLQGQFKDSVVTYRHDEINRAIFEAWAGYTVGLDHGYSLTYSIRGHTSELKRGIGDRNVVWGGVQLLRTFG